MTYVLITTALFLAAIVGFLLYKYKKIIGRKFVEMSREEVLGKFYLRKLRKMGEEAAAGDVRELFKRLGKTMRGFLNELYEIKLEFSDVKLNEVLAKKGVSESLRRDVISYMMYMEEAEYGGHDATRQEFYVMLEKSKRMVAKLTGSRDMAPPEKEPEERPAKKVSEKEKRPIPDVIIPKKEEERMEKLRSLLVEAENCVRENRHEEAGERYTELRGIYDSLSPKAREGIQSETVRIIAVYNHLLKEYKSALEMK
jgi:hypothetical protein